MLPSAHVEPRDRKEVVAMEESGFWREYLQGLHRDAVASGMSQTEDRLAREDEEAADED